MTKPVAVELCCHVTALIILFFGGGGSGGGAEVKGSFCFVLIIV